MNIFSSLVKRSVAARRRRPVGSRPLAVWAGLLTLGLLTGCFQPPAPPSGASERVVSLAPSLTEIICALGAGEQLVGRTSACDYPPELLNSVPVIGGFGAPSLDLLLQIQPSLVLTMDLEDETLAKAIDQLGLRRERIRCATIDDIPSAIRRVGELLQRQAAAETLAGNIQVHLAALRQEARQRQAADQTGPRVFIELWGSPLTTAGKNSFVSDLVYLAGGHNIGAEVTQKDYFTVSSEWVIARNPEVIVCLYMSGNQDAPAEQAFRGGGEDWARLQARTGWAGIAAVRQRRIYGGLDNNIILRPGPRILEGVAIMNRCITEAPLQPGDQAAE